MQLCRKITNNNPNDKAFYVFLILPYFINTENSFRNEIIGRNQRALDDFCMERYYFGIGFKEKEVTFQPKT